MADTSWLNDIAEPTKQANDKGWLDEIATPSVTDEPKRPLRLPEADQPDLRHMEFADTSVAKRREKDLKQFAPQVLAEVSQGERELRGPNYVPTAEEVNKLAAKKEYSRQEFAKNIEAKGLGGPSVTGSSMKMLLDTAQGVTGPVTRAGDLIFGTNDADQINHQMAALNQADADIYRQHGQDPALPQLVHGVVSTVAQLALTGKFAETAGLAPTPTLSASMGLQHANQAYTQAKDMGLSGPQATAYAATSGGLTAGLLMLMPGFARNFGEEAMAGSVKEALKQIPTKALENVGFSVIGPVVQAVADQTYGVDPEAFTLEKLTDSIKSSLITNFALLGVTEIGSVGRSAVQTEASRLGFAPEVIKTERPIMPPEKSVEAEPTDYLSRFRTLATQEGAAKWATDNPEAAAKVAENPSRRAFEEAGLPPMAGEGRQQFSTWVKDATKAPETPPEVAPAEPTTETIQATATPPERPAEAAPETVPPVEQAKAPELPPEAPKVPEAEVTPVETPAEAQPQDLRFSSRQADIAQLRDAMGMDQMPETETLHWDDVLSEAQRRGAADLAMVHAQDVIENPKALDDVQTAGLLIKQVELKNLHERLTNEMNATTDPVELADKAAQVLRVEQDSDMLSQARHLAGTEAGRRLNLQKLEIARDYSLLSVKNRAKAAKGAELTAEETKSLEKLTQTLKEKEALTEAVQERAKAETAKTQRVLDKLKEQAPAELQPAIKELEDRVNGKPSPESADQIQKDVDALREKVETAPLPDPVRKLAQKLARVFVEGGVENRMELVRAVHEELKQSLPDVTLRQVANATDNYGTFKTLSKDAVDITLRDLKGQLQELSKLADMAEGRAPKASGFERPSPSDTKREITKRVNEAKKEGSYNVTDPATQLKTALDAIKTRLKNQITDLKKQIESRTKIVKLKRETPQDAESQRLMSERDQLQQQFDAIFGKSELTDAQRIEIAKRAVEKSIEDYEGRLKRGDYSSPEKRSTPESKELTALQAKRDALREQYRDANPNPPELQKAQAKLAELQKHLDEGTLPPPAKKLEPNLRTKDIREQIANVSKAISQSEPAQRQRLEKSLAELQARLQADNFQLPKSRQQELSPELDRLAYDRDVLRSKIRQKINDLRPRTLPWKIARAAKEISDLPRAIIASDDLSAFLQQGVLFSLGHPIKTALLVPDILKSTLSSAGAHEVESRRIIAEIEKDPLLRRAKMYFAPGEYSERMGAREEAYLSNLVRRIPVLGPVFRGTERAYITTLNLMRMGWWKEMAQTLPRNGDPTHYEGKVIANAIKVGSGRGGPEGMRSAEDLSRIFFSPRYWMSRASLLIGEPLWHGTARTRRIIATEMYARPMLGLVTFYAMLGLGGGKLDTDPNSSNFGAMTFGENWHINPVKAFTGIISFFSRLATGSVTTQSGLQVPKDRWELMTQYGRGKFSPTAGTAVNILQGKNVIGEPTTPLSVLRDLTLPMAPRDIAKGMEDDLGVPHKTVLSILAFFGAATSIYEPRDKSRQEVQKQIQGLSAGEQYNAIKASEEAGKITKGQASQLKNNPTYTPFQAAFDKLGTKESIYAFERATPDQKKEVYLQAAMRIEHSDLPNDEKTAALKSLGPAPTPEIQKEIDTLRAKRRWSLSKETARMPALPPVGSKETMEERMDLWNRQKAELQRLSQ